MINKIKSKFSVKIFLTTFLLFIFVSVGTFFLVSKLIPTMYTNVLNEDFNQLIGETLVDFANKDDINDCIKILNEQNIEKNNRYWIYDESGNTVYSSDNSTRELENYDDNFNQTSKPKGSQSISQYSFSLQNNKQYNLMIETDLSEVTQIKNILLSILPYVILLDSIISLLCSLFYSKYISKPILKLCKRSQEMAEFNFTTIPEVKRVDEIGVLSNNLSFLSQTLQNKITELNHTNAQLKSDIDKKREIEHSRMAFFTATSHELKTPVTILKGHLNGMLDQVGNYLDREKYLKRSINVTEQMESLIKELLYLTTLEDDKKSVCLKEEDCAEIIRQELSSIMDLIDDKELQLNMEIPDHLICMLDKDLMHTILQNLMMNAIRYSPNREDINISLCKDNRKICFTIENTGVHIPEESLNRIFDAFYKVDNSRNSKGTGLGLYIVRELLERHNANYMIYNTSRGVGFEFTFSG